MTKASADIDRRQHPRFPMRAYAQLHYGKQQWEAHLLDMSFSGAKLALLDEHMLRPGDQINLTVSIEALALDNVNHQTIHLRGTLVHLREHLLGVEYQPVSETDKQLLILFLSQAE
jgi:c-di-GMP-binding flagellar brake protein YcgR